MGRLNTQLVDKSINIDQSNDWLIHWLNGWLIDWLNGWLIEWLVDWLIVWTKIELFWFGVGHKDFDLTYLEEAYTTEHWLVRIYRSVTCYPESGPVFIEDPGTWGSGSWPYRKMVRQNSKNFNKHWSILIFSIIHSLTCYQLSGSGTVLLKGVTGYVR